MRSCITCDKQLLETQKQYCGQVCYRQKMRETRDFYDKQAEINKILEHERQLKLARFNTKRNPVADIFFMLVDFALLAFGLTVIFLLFIVFWFFTNWWIACGSSLVLFVLSYFIFIRN